MTPTQLRAFAAVVRLGSVKHAAAELNVSESAVSLNIGQLRKELGDRLFTRTAAGLAFTPGGLRLATRAADLGVELSVSDPGQFTTLLLTRAADIAIGPEPAILDSAVISRPIMNFQIILVVGPDHPMATVSATPRQL